MSNDSRKDMPSVLRMVMDKAPKKTSKTVTSADLIKELTLYFNSVFTPIDEDLIKVYGPLLFYKENEADYPILCEMAKAIFSLLPASTSIEGIFTSTKMTHTDKRKRLHPKKLEDLTLLKCNKHHL